LSYCLEKEGGKPSPLIPLFLGVKLNLSFLSLAGSIPDSGALKSQIV